MAKKKITAKMIVERVDDERSRMQVRTMFRPIFSSYIKEVVLPLHKWRDDVLEAGKTVKGFAVDKAAGGTKGVYVMFDDGTQHVFSLGTSRFAEAVKALNEVGEYNGVKAEDVIEWQDRLSSSLKPDYFDYTPPMPVC